jgi:hypothetical protein
MKGNIVPIKGGKMMAGELYWRNFRIPVTKWFHLKFDFLIEFSNIK